MGSRYLAIEARDAPDASRRIAAAQRKLAGRRLPELSCVLDGSIWRLSCWYRGAEQDRGWLSRLLSSSGLSGRILIYDPDLGGRWTGFTARRST